MKQQATVPVTPHRTNDPKRPYAIVWKFAGTNYCQYLNNDELMAFADMANVNPIDLREMAGNNGRLVFTREEKNESAKGD